MGTAVDASTIKLMACINMRSKLSHARLYSRGCKVIAEDDIPSRLDKLSPVARVNNLNT
jgi:hypothetical protein